MSTQTVAQSPSLGSRTFLIVWLGQFVSIFGSNLTSFALGVWVYQQTGSVTQFALISLIAIVPRLIIGPIAGAYVDRWDRRMVMLANDLIAGLCTLALVALLALNMLQIWHIYIVVLITTIANTFQWPAFAAATSMLVPPEQLGRANGLGQFSQASAQIVAPALAGLLISVIQIYGIMLIDVVTFVFAVITLAVVRIPSPPAAPNGERPTVLGQMADGWRYIRSRPGLFKLLLFFAVINFMGGLISTLITPLVLSFTNVTMLGTLTSVGGLGMLAGGITLSAWGGPRRRIDGVLGFAGILGGFLILLAFQTTVLTFAVAIFCLYFTLPVINGSNQTIWQTNTPPELQGRVLSISTTIASCTLPLAYLVTGPLVEGVFEPLLAVGGPLAGSLGLWLGVGPGRGIALLFVVAGALTALAAALSYLSRDLREVA
ncbi:MAG: hypothetical protein OHK0022_56130 [Roseiflexaceae bacterium]